MEWNSGAEHPQPANRPASHAGGKKKLNFVNLRIASVVLLFCTSILIIALTGFIASGNSNSDNKFLKVDENNMQAVFLNGGQVYFGKITNINSRFMKVNEIYYLRVNQTVQPDQQKNGEAAPTTANDISLVKLGCELHGPQDSMIINQDQVIFWENLKSDGQVAVAVEKYKKENPGPQKCDTGSQSSTPSESTEPNTSTP